MITTGIIRKINISTSSYVSNKYLIELNIFQIPGDHNKNNYTYEANCSTLPGHYSSYEVGDKVYVGFINEDLSLPVILGKIYQGLDDKSRSYINCQNLNVTGTTRLSKDIKIGDITYSQLLTLFNRESKRYYNHVVKCKLDNDMIVKFKFMNTSNRSYLDPNVSVEYLGKELYRLNQGCKHVCELYEFNSDLADYVYLKSALINIDASGIIGANIDGNNQTVVEILEDTVIEL